MKTIPTVAFVYPNPRARFADDVARGAAPDSTLLGQNHLRALGLDARIHDPLLTRWGAGRLRWHARELLLPFEVGSVRAVVTPLAALFPVAAQLRRALRVVVVNYGLTTMFERSSGARRKILAAAARAADAHVALADWQGETFAAQTGLPRERWRTIPLGIDERWFSPQPAASGEPLVLTVGKDEARDFATFAEAVRGLDAQVELAVYPRNLEGVRLPPNATARVVGPVELRELYRRAACVVLPQRRSDYPYGSEGGGLTALLEAMASARPVVATARPVLAEYVEHERTAVVVPPEEPEALRQGIERVLGDRDLAAKLGTAAREQVEREHTTRRFAERLAALLGEVIDA